MQLKKFTRKDRHGNMMSFEFDIPQANVPAMQSIPMYDHPGDPKGTDTVPAWLTPGEFVVNKEATEMFGPAIKKMNDVGRQKQNEKKTMYAQEGTFVTQQDLDNDPAFQEQLNKMIEKYQGNEFTKDKLYNIIQNESSFQVDAKNPTGSASGLFQFTDLAVKDMKELGLVGKDFTTNQIRDLNPTQQLELYDKYLNRWNYRGDAHLGMMQSAPGLYSKFTPDNNNQVLYNKEDAKNNKDIAEIFERNKKWIDPESGNITLASVSKFYDDAAKKRIPGVTAQRVAPDAISSGAQMPADAKFVPPMNVNMPQKDMASMEPIAGPSSGRIAQVMGNLQPSPTVNITPNNQNVTTDLNEIAEAMAGEYLGERGVLRDMDRGAERRKMFRDAGASFANEFVGIPVPGSNQVVAQPKSVQDAQTMININKGIPDAAPYVPSITNDMLNRRALQEDAEAAVKASINTKIPTARAMPTERDLQNFSGDIDKYIPQVDGPGRSFKKVVNESFPGYNTRLEKESEYPDRILSKALEKGKDINAPMFFPPVRTEENPQGVSTVPKGETETFRGTINKGEPNLEAAVEKDKTKDNVATEVVNKTDNDKKPEEKDTKQVEETGGKASTQEKSKAEGFLKGLFGSLFDSKELKRMAVMYLGSRVMGYGHNGSLNFAVRNYLTRVDAKEDARRKFAASTEGKRDYEGASLQKYLETGNVSDLIPRQTLIPTQDFKKLYTKNKQGKVIEVIGQKYEKMVGGVKYPVYLDAKGQILNLRNYQEDPINFRDSKESREAVSKYSKEIEEALKSLRNQFGRLGKKKDNQINYISNINPDTEADVLINYALEEGLDITRFKAAVPMAYKAMINDPERAGKPKVNSLLGYINDVYMEQDLVENKELFRVEPYTKAEKEAKKGAMVSTRRMEELRQNVATMARIKLGESVKGASDGELFSSTVKRLRVRYDALKDKEKEQFERKAQTVKGRKVESGFFIYVKEYTQEMMNKQ